MGKIDKKKKKLRRFTNKHRNRQATFVGVVLTIMLLALGFRIYWYQTGERGDSLRIESARQQNLTVRAAALQTIPASRGEILDRNMQPLALSRPVYDVFIDVVRLHDESNRNELGRQTLQYVREAVIYHFGSSDDWTFLTLDAHFALNSEGQLARRNHHLIVGRNVEPALAHYLRDRFRHVHATRQTQRFYPAPTVAPQVVGFERGGYLWGLESFYNTYLTGTPGRRFSAHGEVEEIPVVHGHTLVTTIDMEIQRLAQASVDRTFREMNADFAGVIIMQPFTGEIFAMAQAPSFSLANEFDPHLTTDTWLQANWDAMTPSQQVTEMQRMWRNFHISYTYEVGSVFKPFIIAAAIEEGVISRNQYFICTGRKVVFPGEPPLPCHSTHGRINLTTAIYRSCNVAMFYIANMMGRDMFYRYRGYFGFGERTGIDLSGERCVSERVLMYTHAALGPVQLATSSMGQGFNATTIQSITAFSALINGGNLMQPFVVSHILDSDGNIVQENKPTIIRPVISPQTSHFMREQMHYVVAAPGGTAHRYGRIPGHTLGGKTGTAQQGRRDAGINTLTYIAYTPVENPEFVVLMVVHRICRDAYGGSGRELSPRTARLIEEIITHRGMPPSDGPYAQSAWQYHTAPDTMPHYEGQRLVDAVRDLSTRSTVGYEVIGSGTIVDSTIPAPGAPMPQNVPVFFRMVANTELEGQMVTVPDLVGLTDVQALHVLHEFGLPLQHLGSLVANITHNEPRTTNPLTQEELDEGAQTQAQTAYVIYRQYPAPGTELARGTPVMIRAR